MVVIILQEAEPKLLAVLASMQTDGAFGKGGAGIYSSTYKTTSGYGGYGWYGGAGGSEGNNEKCGGGGGGSGFLIGVSTTTYPSGYLGDDTDLQATIASAISEGTLTQGGSEETTPKMVLTILARHKPPVRLVNFHYYNGTQFVEAEVYRYNGTLFERVEPKIYTNSQWQ